MDQNHPHTSSKSYVIGFVLSIACTLAAYVVVRQHVSADHTMISHGFLILIVILLALAQLIVQLIFFLHLGRESRPHSHLIAFVYTALLVTCLVVGSLWIMYHLNYNMTGMAPTDMDTYMLKQ